MKKLIAAALALILMLCACSALAAQDKPDSVTEPGGGGVLPSMMAC